MSMLAEPRRKQRWTLNPRGKLWTEDTNSFGQQMLKRMGWKTGKGLGANEDGKTEPLRVSYKNDSKGMGYKETEQWTAHDDNFSSLLESLNGNKASSDSNSTKVNSLQTKVQNCKSRINYHKFTKAKDLSRYSEKDLANIFGKKTLKQKNTKEETKEPTEKISETNDTLVKEDEVLVNRGSMVDYFKKKLPNFARQNSEYVIGNNGVLTRERSDSESEVRTGFGFSQENNDRNGDINVEQSEKKKKRKYAETFFSYLDKDTENIEETEHVQKKKSKKNKLDSNFVHRRSEEITDNNVSKNYEESFALITKNKKNKTIGNFVSYVTEDDNESISIDQVKDSQNLECEEIPKQKKKKKVKSKVNENLDNCNDCESSSKNINSKNNEESYQEVFDNDLSKNRKTKKSKHKKKENLSEQIIADNLETANEDIVKTKNKAEDDSLKHIASKEDVENTLQHKKKKGKDNKEIACEVAAVTSDRKLKKHKKKKNEDTSAYDFNVNNEITHDIEHNIDNVEESLHKQERISFKSYIKENYSDSFTKDNTDCISKKKLKIKKTDSELEENETRKEITSYKESTSQNNGNKHDSEIIEENSIENDDVSKKIKKHKKSKKNKKDESENFGISNPAFSDFNNCVSNDEYSLQNGHTNEEGSLNEDTPRRKKKKRKHEEISNEGIDNPTFSENLDNSNLSQNEESSNPYEIKVKKKKTSDEKTSKLDNIGLDNPALNLSDSIPDTDLMLNIISTPTTMKKSNVKVDLKPTKERTNRVKRKSVRFSDILQEIIIPNDPSERSNEYLANRNEFFDINTTVVEDGVREEMKKRGIPYESSPTSFELNSNDPKEISKKVVESSVKEELNRGLNPCGFVNNGFDIRSVDKVNFYETKYEVKSPNSKGIDNKAFNKVKNHIEENVESISNTIDRFQAEVENNINEAKINENTSVVEVNFMVGDVGTQIDKSMKIKEGTKLCFKEMHFKTSVPAYLRGTVSTAKKSYRHLIRGDITVAFKNSNLHDLPGYSVRPKDGKLGSS